MPGPKSDKIFADAVRRAVLRRIENKKENPRKLERLADNLVDYAIEGQGWAVQEVANRLDGRPAQAIQGSEDDGSIGITFKTIIEK